jgi:general secretion pathway protein A
VVEYQFNDRFLLTVVLIGQPELRHRVARIPQLNQRIAVRAHLGPFMAKETTSYNTTRMGAMTDRTRVYERGDGSHIRTKQGIGRIINALCDHCLFAGTIEHSVQIDDRLVQRAGANQMMDVRILGKDVLGS